jgi:hypothetical protein
MNLFYGLQMALCLKPRLPIRPLWTAEEVHGYSFFKVQAGRDLSDAAKTTIAHLVSRRSNGKSGLKNKMTVSYFFTKILTRRT